MHGYIERAITQTIQSRLSFFPALALLGPRQTGKSTLAKQIIDTVNNAVYLDLERPADLNKINDPEVYFSHHKNGLICLDEIQRAPDLFPFLRGFLDRNDRGGQLLILGSASRDLLKQSSESLAGRISYLEISPFTLLEIDDSHDHTHWLRGGFPRSFLAPNNELSFVWREDYIASFLERDIPQIGFNIPALTLSRFWRMLAHNHGQCLNSAKLANSMAVSAHTIRSYIDILESTFIVRTLLPYVSNIKKRMIKSPKVYIRDTGLLHALLDIRTFDDLLGHPVYGPSFEGYVIDNILSSFPDWKGSFYRTSNGAEIDLVLNKGQKSIAIEIKASSAPQVSKGFWSAIEDIQPTESWVIAPVMDTYTYKKDVNVTNLSGFLSRLKNG